MNKLEIINFALLRVGQRALQGLDEDSSDARLVRILFDPTLEEVLREETWNCCSKRVQLALTTDQPLFGYKYSFNLPADFVRIVDVYDNTKAYNPHFHWKVETGEVLTDSLEVYMNYVFIPTDHTILDILTAQALVIKLATKLAYPKTEDKGLVAGLIKEYEQLALQKAKSIDSMDNYEESRMGEVDWIEGRNISIQ